MKITTTAVALACLSGQVLGRAVSHRGGALNLIEHPDLEQRALLQNIVSPQQSSEHCTSRLRLGRVC